MRTRPLPAARRALVVNALALACLGGSLGAMPGTEIGPTSVTERPVDLDLESRRAAAERWYREGRGFLGRGQYEEARDCLRAAVQLDPQLLGAYKGLAKAYRALHLPAREIAVLRQAIENNPVPEGTDSSGELVQSEPSLWLYMNLATSQRRQGDVEDARATLEAALEHDPGFWSASRLLATWLHEERDLQASDRILDAAFDRLCTPKEGPLAEERRERALTALTELYEELGRPRAVRRFAR